jgi:hypothetical protein
MSVPAAPFPATRTLVAGCGRPGVGAIAAGEPAGTGIAHANCAEGALVTDACTTAGSSALRRGPSAATLIPPSPSSIATDPFSSVR